MCFQRVTTLPPHPPSLFSPMTPPTSCWSPLSQSHSLFLFFFFPPTVCRRQGGQAELCNTQRPRPAGMCVCVASAAVAATNMLAGKPGAWSRVSSLIWRGVSLGVRLHPPPLTFPPLWIVSPTDYWFEFFLSPKVEWARSRHLFILVWMLRVEAGVSHTSHRLPTMSTGQEGIT